MVTRTNGTVSGSAVSESAVTGSAISDSVTSKKEWAYPNSTLKKLYVNNPDKGFYQMNHDGSEKRFYAREGYESFIKADETGVYYVCENQEQEMELYWLPVKNEKEELDEAREELILVEPRCISDLGNEPIYIDSEKVIYCSIDCVWYDREKREIIPLDKDFPTDYVDMVATSENMVIFCYTEGVETQRYLWLDLETKEWEYFDENECLWNGPGENLRVGHSFYYFVGEVDIRRFDMNTRQISDFVKEKDLENVILSVVEENEKEDVCWWLDNLFWDDGRLYFQVAYTGKDSERRYLIFSRDETLEMITYEKELTDCMESEFASESGEAVRAKYLVYGNMIYQHFLNMENDEEPWEFEYGYYNLKNRTFRKFKEGDTMYYAPYHVNRDPYYEDL